MLRIILGLTAVLAIAWLLVVWQSDPKPDPEPATPRFFENLKEAQHQMEERRREERYREMRGQVENQERRLKEMERAELDRALDRELSWR